MVITYFDESGDDGYPKYSSELFVMSCIYMTDDQWQKNFDRMYRFKLFLRKQYGFHVREEFHTRQFLQDKDPYHGLYLPAVRKEILNWYAKLINVLDVKIINVVIDKKRAEAAGKTDSYNVLEQAFTYAIQRLENDMNKSLGKANFMIITDEGRVNAMRSISRKIRKINFVPSQFDPSSYRSEISNLIEDPLPKDSKDSLFIQLADTMAYVVLLYAKQNLMEPTSAWPKRVRKVLDYGDERKFLDQIISRLNTKASTKNKYGIVYYPK